MKTKITLTIITVFSFFSPISLTILLLMGMILLDTIVKLFSLKEVAKSDGRKYLEVFKSEILRKKFILKSIGYFLLILPISVIDILVLTPCIDWILDYYYQTTLPIRAVISNLLIIMFCFMELSSINENWNTLTGSNLFKSVQKIVKKIRGVISDIAGIKKQI